MRHLHTALFEAMRTGAMLVTPNNRLSNQLLQDYIRNSEAPCLDKPRCLPYPAFLKYLFQQHRHHNPYTKHPRLLSNAQLRLLLRQIIAQSRGDTCNDGLLHAVLEAWTSCQDWLLESTHPAFQSLAQTRQFQTWQQTLEQQLQDLHAITDCQLPRYLLNHAFQKPADTLVWVCFDDYTPAQRALMHALSEQDCLQRHDDFTHAPKDSHCMPTADTAEEYQQLIAWLKTKRAAGEQYIGVVVPDLAQESAQLDRLLKRHFSNDEINISLGRALADYPLVAHALQWLKLDDTTLSRQQARLLLHSPFIQDAQMEGPSRAQFMQDSRLIHEAFIPVPLLKAALARPCPALKQSLDNLTHYPMNATMHGWVSIFNQRLTALGFPGEVALDSATYQCLQRFQALLDELRELAVVAPSMTHEQALDALIDLAQTTIFQPQKTNAPIQISGLLEASGCTFDSLWVTGMTDQCLPQKARLSAFIPIELQRELNMPHANTARELHFATETIRRLQQGSDTSLFSYPHLVGDRPSLPSPLIAHLPLKTPIPVPDATDATRLILHEETYTIPMRDDERATGGTSLLANQAKCPFRAFAAHRLHAKADLPSSDGLSAMERGQLIHRILEILWKTIQNQETLLRYDAETLAALIQQAISTALEPVRHDHPLSFHPLVQSMEMKRLTELVYASLAWERTRPDFEVEALEQAAVIDLAGLELHVKIDRLDRVRSGKKWVIDYKSRLPTSKPWLEERPDAPQLLLYALLDEAIHALLFVELKQGQVACAGFSEEASTLEGMRSIGRDECWSTHQTKWREQLTTLALEFKAGLCLPQPTRSSTCATCEFQNLCRIRQ